MSTLIQKTKKWFGYSLNLIRQSFERFPITLVMTLAFVVMSMVSVHSDMPDDYQNYLMIFALGMPFSGALKLLYEKIGKINMGIQGLLTLVFIGSYYFFIPEVKTDVYWGQYFVLLTLLYAIFFLVPYFSRREGFSLALVERAGKFFLTALYAMILYAGINAVFFSVEGLFELNFPSELPADIFFCVFGFFGVPYFLGSLPSIEHQEIPEDFSKIFKTLFLYILIPIQSVYTLILYAYFIRLLILRTLPEGLIGNLVLWYALVSFVTLFSVKDLRESLPWLNKYIKGFSIAMIVPMAMLIVAMGIRVSHYGLTMPRYLSIVAMTYLIMGYVMLPIKKRDMAIPLYVLAVCMLSVSFFGIFSWDRVVLKEQTNRLEKHMVAAGYNLDVENWNVPDEISDDHQQEISNSLYYLTNHYEVSDIKILPKDFTIDQADQYLGFEIQTPYGYYDRMNYFNKSFINQNAPLDVRGYDYLMMVNRYDAFQYTLYDERLVLEKKEMVDKIGGSSIAGLLRVTMDGFLVGEIDTDALVQKAFETDQGRQTLELKTPEGETLTLVFDFIEIGGTTKNTGDFNNVNYYQSWLGLIKK